MKVHWVRVWKSGGKYMASECGKVVASTWGLRESGKVVAGTWGQSQQKWQAHGVRVRKSGGKYMGSELGKVVRCGARITRVISRRYTGAPGHWVTLSRLV